jgi:hypothetical protein
VVVLQNSMELVKGDLGSYNESSVTSTVDGNEMIGIEAERVTGIKEEEDQEPMTILVINTESKVNGVPVMNTFHMDYIQNCLSLLKKIKSRECVFFSDF